VKLNSEKVAEFSMIVIRQVALIFLLYVNMKSSVFIHLPLFTKYVIWLN